MINLYQHYISPRKGFRCAYGALHGTGTCSQIVKNIVSQHGLITGWPKIRRQFRDCKSAYLQLQENPDLDRGKKKKEKKKKRWSDYCDCPSPCDIPGSCGGKGGGGGGGGGGLDCDSPCDFDLPCDCSP